MRLAATVVASAVAVGIPHTRHSIPGYLIFLVFLCVFITDQWCFGLWVGTRGYMVYTLLLFTYLRIPCKNNLDTGIFS